MRAAGQGCLPFRLAKIALNITCMHSRVVFGVLADMLKLATTAGYAAATLAVSSSLTSSGWSHFVATRTMG